MKRFFLYLLVCVIFVFSFSGCNNDPEVTNPDDYFDENKIDWTTNPDGTITSFETDVEVYSMNNRHDSCFKLTNKYNLAVKRINDDMYVRIDLDAQTNGGTAITVISNDSKILIVDTLTNAILQTLPVVDSNDKDLDFLKYEACLSTVNLDFIKAEVQRLSLGYSDDTAENLLTINIPVSKIQTTTKESRVSSTVVFNSENKTLKSVKNVTMIGETTVTSTQEPVYKEYTGIPDKIIPIKVGTITIINSNAPTGKIPNFGTEYETYDNIEDIPDIDSGDLEKLKEAGNVSKENSIIFGDTTDLSYIETVVEKYVAVKINETDDSKFSLLLGQ